MPNYSPDELKAIALHYGSFERAAKAFHIPAGSLARAAKADITGNGFQLAEKSTEKISEKLKRLSTSSKTEIRQYVRMFRQVEDHPNIKKALLNTSTNDRKMIANNLKKYSSRLRQDILWTKIMAKLYDKYQWQRGKFSR